MSCQSRLLLLCLILGAGAPLAARADVYKWVDANGQTHYSDVPPADGSRTQTVGVPPPPPRARSGDAPAADGADAASAARNPASAGKDKDGKDGKDKDGKTSVFKPGSLLGVEDPAAARARSENCARGKAELQALKSDNRLFTIDAQGERQYLDDQQRAARIAELQKMLPGECN